MKYAEPLETIEEISPNSKGHEFRAGVPGPTCSLCGGVIQMSLTYKKAQKDTFCVTTIFRVENTWGTTIVDLSEVLLPRCRRAIPPTTEEEK